MQVDEKACLKVAEKVAIAVAEISAPSIESPVESRFSSEILTTGRSQPSSHQTCSKLLVWTAADQKALSRLTDTFSDHFRDTRHLDGSLLDDLAYTLANRRSLHAWRSFALVDQSSELGQIKKLMSQPSHTATQQGLAFVLSGQGAQYERMGAALLAYPAFYKTLQQCDASLSKLGCEWSVVGK